MSTTRYTLFTTQHTPSPRQPIAMIPQPSELRAVWLSNTYIPSHFRNTQSVFVFQKNSARLHGWLFQDSSFSPEHSGKGVFMVHLTSPHRPILQNYKTPSTRLLVRLYPPTGTAICVITRLRTTWQRCSCQLYDFESSAHSAVYFALSYCLSGPGVIRGPRLTEYPIFFLFWRVYGTGRKIVKSHCCDSAIPGSRLLAGVQVLLFDKDISLWRDLAYRRVCPCPLLHVSTTGSASAFFVAQRFPRVFCLSSIRCEHISEALRCLIGCLANRRESGREMPACLLRV